MYDLIIKNGKIIDGTGKEAYFADVAISDGKIVKIGDDISDGKKIIDAAGYAVTPGFIDSHSHSDRSLLTMPEQVEKLEQGITTSISGQCGSSIAPLGKDYDTNSDEKIGCYGRKADVLKTFGSLANAVKDASLGSNMALLVGHGSIRNAVMGLENRAPSADELEMMKNHLRDALSNGAIGISFGLIYTPGCYAATDELIELAKVAAEYDALICAHIRNEGDFLVEAVEEFLTVIKESGARAVFSHHKAMFKQNWGKVNKTLELIEEANKNGSDIYCDTYPYTASGTTLSARFIPKEYRTGGVEGMAKVLSDSKLRSGIKESNVKQFGENFDWVIVSECDAYPQYEGLTVTEIAKLHGKDGYKTVYDMIAHSKTECNAYFFTACEDDVKTVLRYPRTMICTDSDVAGSKKNYHPRLSASFPRALGKYVREEKVVGLCEMIRRMTSLPASVYGLKDKGVIAEGYDADICIFDPETIADRADYSDYTKKAIGLHYVIAGGEVVVENAVSNGKKCGKVLLGCLERK